MNVNGMCEAENERKIKKKAALEMERSVTNHGKTISYVSSSRFTAM